MTSLCILALSTIHRDARVLRQIDFAARAGYEVTVVGFGHLDKERPNVTMRPVRPGPLDRILRIKQVSRMLGGRFIPRLFEHWFWNMPGHRQALAQVLATTPDLIHANDAMSLPIAMAAAEKTGAKVLFDAHEYSPEQGHSLKWRVMVRPFSTYLIKHYAPQADAMITVETHIAQRYARLLGRTPQVIRNIPPWQAGAFHPTNPEKIRLIHHGAAFSARKMETMIQVMALVDKRFTLDFMLVPDGSGYLEKLKTLADEQAPHRITFREPVAPAAIVQTISAYDVGLFLLPPSHYSYQMALPNKFFEFIMAGLAVAIGPSPAMAALTRQYNLGVIADDFSPEALARQLNALTTADIDAMKQRSLAAAQELNAENEMQKLLSIYENLLTITT